MRRSNSFRPWFFQIHYLVICFVYLYMPFLIGAGKRPVLYALIYITALFLQTRPYLAIIGIRNPLEIKLFTLWGVWAIATGGFVAVSNIQFLAGVNTMIRQVLLVWAAYAIFVRQHQYSYYFWMLIAVATLNICATRLGFHVETSAGFANAEFVRDFVDLTTTRAEGLTGNANEMGFSMLAGIWACMMLWRKRTGIVWGKVRHLIFVVLMIIFAYYAIQTGSRKTLLVMGIVTFAWATWMLPGRFSVKSVVISVVLGLVMLAVAFFVMEYVMTDTVLGKRLLKWFDAGGGSAAAGFKEDIRYWLYMDGFKFWQDNPIAGIGLRQFAVRHWSGLYSHSDYMEPLACTGLVGFILYQGFALTIVMRLLKLLYRKIPADISYNIKGMFVFMLCNHYLIGLGAPWWDSFEHFITLVFIGTYAFRTWSEWEERRPLYAT